MKNSHSYPEKKRPVDELAEKSYSWWGKSLVFIMTKKIKTWQGVFLLAFISGIVIAAIWTVSLNIQ